MCIRDRYTPPANATASTGSQPAVVAAATPSSPAATPKIWTGVFSAAQAKRGETEFQRSRLPSPGSDLQGLPGRGPALSGAPFMTNWETESVANLFNKLKTTM